MLTSVTVQSPSSRFPRVSRLRCPHCKREFPPRDKGRCPECGRVVLIPPAARQNAAEMRDRWIRASRDRRERLATLRHDLGAAASRRMRITLAAVAFVILGVVLPLRYVLTRDLPVQRELPPEVRTTQNLWVLRTALECFRRDCGRYPTTAEGLRALVRQPPQTPSWKGPYIELLKPDPWRHPYVYQCTNGVPRLVSQGPDGRGGTADDIAAPPPDLSFVYTVTPSNAPPTEAAHPAGYVDIVPAP